MAQMEETKESIGYVSPMNMASSERKNIKRLLSWSSGSSSSSEGEDTNIR